MNFGIFENVSFKEYKDVPYINKSSLDKIAKSPSHYKYSLDNPEDPTPAMEFGSAFHDYVLLPDQFEKQYIVSPGFDRRTTIGKSDYLNFLNKSAGKTIVTKDDITLIESMRQSLKNNPAAAELLSLGKPEVSCFWQDGDIACKARADIFIPDARTLVDIKTTQDGSFTAFQRSIANYRYHVQAGMYVDGFSRHSRIDNFVFIVVEKTAPYATAIYVLDEASIEKGREIYKTNINTYADCIKNNAWPSYTTEPTLINLPAFAW